MHITEDGEIFSEDEDTALEAEGEQSSLPFVETENVSFSSGDKGEHESDSKSLVIMRTLTSHDRIIEKNHEEQRTNLFHMKCKVSGKTCLVIVDGGSCTNAISEEFVKNAAFHTTKHPRPYKLQWIGDHGEVR